MRLPEPVRVCIDALEKAGYPTYAVGGCVRDSYLGLAPHDYDLCTAATPEQIKAVFSGYSLVLAGEKHGTIGVIADQEVYEITTFRTEGDYQDRRHPDWVEFVADVKEDLLRRDFTVNAMAWSPLRGYADPWGGRQDLDNRILRAVGDPEKRFSEDALRILRGVRFAVTYNLQPEEKTLDAMIRLAPTMEKLARERVFTELCKLLPRITAQQLKRYAPILLAVVPELEETVGLDQKNRHHIHDVFTHTAQVVEHVPEDLALRWAALLHDVGKPACFTLDAEGEGHFHGHAKVSAAMAEEALYRLRAPTALREQVVQLIGQHMTLLTPDKKLLRRRLGKLGTQIVEKLLILQKADHGATCPGRSDGPDFDQIEEMLLQIRQEQACLTVKDLSVDGHDLMALGYAPGPALGKELEKLLQLVQDEALPNQRETLLEQATRDK